MVRKQDIVKPGRTFIFFIEFSQFSQKTCLTTFIKMQPNNDSAN